jgi:DNA-binding transcriptional ArsR family regulator
MRPIYHPSIDEISVEGILHAFADPVRLEIFANLAAGECAQNCSAFLNIQNRPVPKSTLSEHFRVLREAGLIRSERKGVELVSSTRYHEIEPRFGAMIKSILDAYAKEQQALRSGENVSR